MDGEKKNLMEICEDMAKLSKSTVKVVDKSLKVSLSIIKPNTFI